MRQTVQRVESNGGRAIAVVADVAGAEGSRRMVDDCRSGVRPGRCIASQRPVRGSRRQREEPALADWDALHAVTVRAAYLGIKRVIPELRRSGGGAIVLTAGATGMVADPHLATMNGALRSLCRSVATGYGKDNIRINTICPGTGRGEGGGRRRSPRHRGGAAGSRGPSPAQTPGVGLGISRISRCSSRHPRRATSPVPTSSWTAGCWRSPRDRPNSRHLAISAPAVAGAGREIRRDPVSRVREPAGRAPEIPCARAAP